jgi:hypothetical protein
VHALEGPRREEPFEQRRPADAERMLQVLARPGAEAVDRDGEAMDAKKGQAISSEVLDPSPASLSLDSLFPRAGRGLG